MRYKQFLLALLLDIPLIFSSCSDLTKADEKISPGILRVILESDPADSTISILGVTYGIGEDDSLGINVYQGRAVNVDSNFALLYTNVNSWRQDQHTYNLLKMTDGVLAQHTVFESFVPQGNYKSISMGLEGFHLQVGPYSIPVELKSDLDPVAEFAVDYQMEQSRVTEVHILIEPLSSMTRQLDSYVFSLRARVGTVHYLPESEFDEIVADLPYLINPNDPFGQ
jgi:hypothetical protein